MVDATTRMFERCDQLGTITDEPGHICRTFLSPAMARVNILVGQWMEEVGCQVATDDWGNLIGHLPAADPQAKTLLIGSHLDTVRDAGKYDGPLGIVVAIEALGELKRLGVQLPYHVDILAFSDEEGMRFQSAYLGSKALTGQIDMRDLALTDVQGISVREAVAKFQAVAEVELPRPRYRPEDLMGYIELHIEQGPVLENLEQSLGVVEYIAAQNRFLFVFHGMASHAGPTPMKLRRDALVGAAEFVLRLEQLGLQTHGLVVTVGQIEVRPNVSNVIPARVQLTVDMRHADAGQLDHASNEMHQVAEEIARRRGLTIAGTLTQGTAAVHCAPRLVEQLDQAISPAGAPRLVSGAGHDGVVLSSLTEVGMIFVRCKDGISHHPSESVTAADVEAAWTALVRFLGQIS